MPGSASKEPRSNDRRPQDSRRVLETLIGNLPGLVYRCENSPRWPFSFVSEGCLEITGWSSQDLVERGVDFGELIVPEDRAAVWEQVQAALTAREPFLLSYRIHRRDGERRWIWEKGCGVFDEHGDLECLEGVILDVTQQKELEQQLLQAQKMEVVGRLVGGVAHDFNNLLTVILGYADMLVATLPQGQGAQGQAQQILRAAQRAADLTRRLLAFARKQVVESRPFDLSELVLSMDPMLRRLIGEDVELVTVPAPRATTVVADPGLIELVLVNLAVNSRQAMPGGGKLTVEVSEVRLSAQDARAHPQARAGDYVAMVVRDTGAGMDARTLAQLFEPFFTTKPRGEGTGLGLSTCQGIVRQAGGFISVASAPDRGSTFRVHLPRADDRERAQPFSTLPVEALRGRGQAVLIVEDDPLVRQLASEGLSALGYEVIAKRSGVEALEACRQRAGVIDVLITDLVLPRMSGGALAERVRELYPATRVLYVSGYAEGEVLPTGAQRSDEAFMAKPFTPRSLAEAVQRLLGAQASS